MPYDLHHPPHMTVTPFWADLTATLDAHDLMHLLDEQLAKPTIGHPMYAARRHACRIMWLEAELAVLRSYDLAVAA